MDRSQYLPAGHRRGGGCETRFRLGDDLLESFLRYGKEWDDTNFAEEIDDPLVQNGRAFDPRSYYSYALDRAIDIPAIVPAGAGAGKIDPLQGL